MLCNIISYDSQFCVIGCSGLETTHHLFLSCPAFVLLWCMVRSWIGISSTSNGIHLEWIYPDLIPTGLLTNHNSLRPKDKGSNGWNLKMIFTKYMVVKSSWDILSWYISISIFNWSGLCYMIILFNLLILLKDCEPAILSCNLFVKL